MNICDGLSSPYHVPSFPVLVNTKALAVVTPVSGGLTISLGKETKSNCHDVLYLSNAHHTPDMFVGEFACTHSPHCNLLRQASVQITPAEAPEANQFPHTLAVNKEDLRFKATAGILTPETPQVSTE